MSLGDLEPRSADDSDSTWGGFPRPKCVQNDGGDGGGDGLLLLSLLQASRSMGGDARSVRAPVLKASLPPRGRVNLRILCKYREALRRVYGIVEAGRWMEAHDGDAIL